ncbi:hypothetical protein HMI56_005988 [Coelomomyces lativittatus]|nr:hypothetical protein HMI56_005988 [Coelomomyces lativittatus]
MNIINDNYKIYDIFSKINQDLSFFFEDINNKDVFSSLFFYKSAKSKLLSLALELSKNVVALENIKSDLRKYLYQFFPDYDETKKTCPVTKNPSAFHLNVEKTKNLRFYDLLVFLTIRHGGLKNHNSMTQLQNSCSDEVRYSTVKGLTCFANKISLLNKKRREITASKS